MRICRNMSPLPRDSFSNSQRRFGRIRCNQVLCSLGEVLDLSAGGMRVRCVGSMGLREGDTVGLTLRASGSPVPLPCKVVWMRKSGWRAWEIGMVFEQPISPSARVSLNALARAVTFQDERAAVSPSGPA